jgi:hypothetical protein
MGKDMDKRRERLAVQAASNQDVDAVFAAARTFMEVAGRLKLPADTDAADFFAAWWTLGEALCATGYCDPFANLRPDAKVLQFRGASDRKEGT